MNIGKKANSLRVELTAEELSSFQLSYGQLDYASPKTKQFLKTLLEGAGRIMGFRPKPHRLLIEVFPAPNRGCTVYFTPLSSAPKRYRRTTPQVYRFASCDGLLIALDRLKDTPQKEVYRLETRYVLVLYQRADWLTEFADPIPATRQNLAYIREHGKRLTPP